MKTTWQELLVVIATLLLMVGAIIYGIKDYTDGGLTPRSPNRFRAELDDLKARVERLEKK